MQPGYGRPARATAKAARAASAIEAVVSVPKAKAGGVVAGVQRDLAEIRRSAPDLAESALAESALALAREIDSQENSATSKSMCARSLLDTLDRLRELAPKVEEKDELDDLAARRARRLGGSAA